MAAPLLLCGCVAQPEWPLDFDGAAAFEEVRRLVEISPRDSGTEGARAAAAHIASRLRAFGLDPEIIGFEDDTPRGRIPFYNVSALLPGRSRERLVLVSHFDTKSGMPAGFQGANDSGSSTGVLLELARQLKQYKPALTLQFLFVDGEECMVAYGPSDGLHGSRYMARKLKEERVPVRAVLVADMIGDADWQPFVAANSDPLPARMLLHAAEAAGLRDRVRLGPPVLDDHVPFREAGFPAALLIDFTYGSAPGLNDWWHTVEDTLDKLSVESLLDTGRLLLHLIGRL